MSNYIVQIADVDIHIHVNTALTDANVIIMFSDEFKRAMTQHILSAGFMVNTLPPGWDDEKIRQHVQVIKVKESPDELS